MKTAYNLTSDYLGWIVCGAGVLLNIILWAIVYLFFPRDVPAAVLHYSIGIGIDFIGEGRQIIMLPAAGFALLLVNIGLGIIVSRVSRRAAWILWGGVPIIQIILIAAFYLLWRFNS